MNVSIALCTYNGARFIKEQIDSIAAQTRLPDELVICDDHSTDDTVAVINSLTPSLPFPVNFEVNPINLGSTRNFSRTLGRCTGDIVLMCDQDDVWHPGKIERVLAEFEMNEDAGLVFSNAELVDESLQPLGMSLWRNTRLWDYEQQEILAGRAFSLQLRRNYVTGATAALQRRYFPLVLPIPDDVILIHDGWIVTLIAAVAPIGLIPEPLVRYRQHASQQIGALQKEEVALRERIRSKAHYAKHLHQVELVRERLADYAKTGAAPNLDSRFAELDSLARHLRARVELPPNPLLRLPRIAGELASGRYRRHSNGWHSALRDLYGGDEP